jgi:hypothetical protein
MAEITDDTKTFTIALTAPEIQAEGKIVSLSYPLSVVHGAAFDVDASTENLGTVSGVFKMQLIINGALKATSAEFTLAGGATSADKIPVANAPATGDSMDITVKCIRIA